MAQKSVTERVYRFSDLVMQVRSKWHLILISMVLFATLFTSAIYLKDLRETRRNDEQKVFSESELEATLTTEELQQITDVEMIEEQIEHSVKYQENSMKMNIDAYQEKKVVLQYYVDTDYSYNMNEDIIPDYVTEIIGGYTEFIRSGGISEILEKIEGAEKDAQYLKELISVCASGKNMFSVSVIADEIEEAEALADVVSVAVEEYQTVINEKIGMHSLILVDKYSQELFDSALVSEQIEFVKTVNAKKELRDQYVSEFSDNQKALWQVRKNEQIMSQDAESGQTPSGVKVNVKVMIFGLFVGGMLACMWSVFGYLMSGKLQNAEDLEQMYSIRNLGTISNGGKKSSRKCEDLSGEDLVCTNIKLLCKKEDIHKIFLISSYCLDEAEKKSIKALCVKMQEGGITLEYGACITHDAKTLERMTEIGKVIIVEKIGKSKYDFIEKEIKICREQEVKLFGTIIM